MHYSIVYYNKQLLYILIKLTYHKFKRPVALISQIKRTDPVFSNQAQTNGGAFIGFYCQLKLSLYLNILVTSFSSARSNCPYLLLLHFDVPFLYASSRVWTHASLVKVTKGHLFGATAPSI